MWNNYGAGIITVIARILRYVLQFTGKEIENAIIVVTGGSLVEWRPTSF
jgi:hypothetical protein